MALTAPSAVLTGSTIATSFDQLLFLDDTSGLTEATLKVVSTEVGKSALQISDEHVLIKGVDTSNAAVFAVQQTGGGNLITIAADTPAVTVGVDDAGADVRVYSATASEGLLYDASEDELGLLLTTKLKFHDIGGGEEIYASANGHLEINSGTTLDMTAPTVDVNASTGVTVDGPATTFASSTSAKPLVIIKNTTNDTTAPTLRFVMDKGSAGADGDDCGTIEFYGDDAGQNQTAFAKIVAEVSEADETDEAGKLSFYVAESDGTNTALTAGLVLEGEHATDGEIDVTIGAGAASTTTIAGDVTIPATKKLYLDAGGNTYLNEVAADTVTLVTGGTEAIRTRSDQSTITELYDAGNNTNAGVVRKVVRGVYTHDSADAIFTVTTVNESGSGDYGVYSCKVHAVIGQCVNCGAGAAVGWQGMWSHYNVDNAGATDAGLNENEETAPAGPNLSTRTISAVTGSVATTSATVTTFSLDATKGGSSPESTYKCVAMVELVYAGYLTPPTITAA